MLNWETQCYHKQTLKMHITKARHKTALPQSRLLVLRAMVRHGAYICLTSSSPGMLICKS